MVTHETPKRSFSHRFWYDAQGNLAIVQRPNWLLVIWVATTTLGFFVSGGTFGHVIGLIGKVAITLWALLELIWGDSYFRRLLGALVILLSLASLL